MSSRLARFCIVPLVACGCAHMRAAAGPVMPDRPGFTDTPTVLPAGSAQIEVGFTDDHSGSSRYQSAGEALVRVGVGGPVELRLFANSYAWRTFDNGATTAGMEDFKVGAKVRLLEKPDSIHSWKPNLSILVATTLPTGAHDIGAGAAQPDVKLAASWTTNSPFAFNASGGIGGISDGTSWSDRGFGSLATWYAATPRVALFVEGMRMHTLSGTAASPSYVDGGFTLGAGDKVQFDARIGRGVGSVAAGEWFFGLGVGVRY